MNQFELACWVLFACLVFATFVCWSINRSFKIVVARNRELLRSLTTVTIRLNRLETEINLYQSGATKEEVEAHFKMQAQMNAANMDYSHNGGQR